MPQIPVVFYQETANKSDVVDWLKDLRKKDPKVFAKINVRVSRLAEKGHELRRPEADLLRDGIYELRQSKGRVNYRLLYFFNGQTIAVVACGLTKEAAVPNTEIDRAIVKKASFAKDPKAHTYEALE